MDESTKNSPCKDCNDGGTDVQLQSELDHLRQHLAERDAHIIAVEAEFLKSTAKTADLEEQLSTWREKYERLYDSHKRVQKLNQVLEDKLLQMVDKMKGDKAQLTKDIATLSVRLAESKHCVSQLHKENERYKNDMNLAIQLLQCKPDNFVSQKLDNLPVDTQARVSQFVMSKTKAGSPNTSQSKSVTEMETIDPNEYEFNISASLMSKILEDSIHDTVTKHCDTCTCMKSQNNPFSYDEAHYSVSTQTILNGDMKNSLCLNCNSDVKSIHSNISIRSGSPHALKILKDRNVTPNHTSVYIVPQNTNTVSAFTQDKSVKENDLLNDKIKSEDKLKLEAIVQKNIITKIGDEIKELKNNFVMEPSSHHRLCDRTKTPMSSHKGSEKSSVVNEDIQTKEPEPKEQKAKSECNFVDSNSLRKNSHSSTGAISRTSSIAKSTTSTHKSNTQVGPGPRFCSLRVQLGSKNILLDNAQPDVPPVLYKRQTKGNENVLLKDHGDGIDNFIDIEREERGSTSAVLNENVVVESTLVDVHVDSNASLEIGSDNKGNNTINPALMNISSSPLQPLKAHSFSNCSESSHNNKVVEVPIMVQSTHAHINPLPSDLNLTLEETVIEEEVKTNNNNGTEECAENHTNNYGIKIFNFDQYEQNKVSNRYKRPLRKIDMSQLHSIENTKISKDLAPQGSQTLGLCQTKFNVAPKSSLPAIVNVYPNLTQTKLKVNDGKKDFRAEQSTSSLSSDDSAALLHKQQLLRVAEWVEQNLEQHNNINSALVIEEDLTLQHRLTRQDSKTKKNCDNLEIVHKMPHPVTKYSNSYTREEEEACNRNKLTETYNRVEQQLKDHITNLKAQGVNNIVKETIFPVENNEVIISQHSKDIRVKHSTEANTSFDAENNLLYAFRSRRDEEISAEELARMEYNVKKFLLSGSQWANNGEPDPATRSRRTSSKTETDL